MKRHLDEELKKLNMNLLTMATLVEEAIHQSVEALKKQDKDLAGKVIDGDQQIDEWEIRIEEEIIDLLVLFQPMAGDLRFITTGMHINAELERIADLTVNIAQRVLDIADQPLLKPLQDIQKLAEQAKWMLKKTIDAFVKRDGEIAKTVIFADKTSNQLRTMIIKELVEDFMVKDGTTAPRAVPLLLVARDLERICDHAVSIAEDTIYMVEAKMVKHHPERIK
ncbi:MAG TPA: phosphate transport system regulatory protein PhoU [Candidatus Omnitrophica bacterium]|nr:MAG: phosphate transport system regulatory protein PhoU [Omnitrophica WOR_2 bacterium GWA2_45_18]HBR14526.1 phosphate transport system regulatory protein PhoU [Candidatus Omnitrophota bacterium]